MAYFLLHIVSPKMPKPDGPPQGQPNKITLVFRTPSGDESVEANLNQPFRVPYEKALRESGNDELDISKYYAEADGQRIEDLSTKVGALGLVDGALIRVRRLTSEGGGR